MDAPSIGMIPSGYKDGKLYSVYPLEGLGEELVTNGTFDTDSNWTKDSAWSINSGKANCDGTQSGNANIYQPISFVVGKVYKVTYELSNVSSGSAKIVFGDTGGTLRSTNGIFTEYYTFVSGSNFYIQGNSSFIGSINNISVKEDTSADFDFTRGSLATRVNAQGLVEDVNIISEELTQNGNFDEIGSEEVSNGDFSQEGSEEITNNSFDTDSDWVKGPRWSISGGKAICSANGKFSFIRQTGVLTSGKIYKITLDFDGSGITSGSIKLNGADFSNASSAERTIVDGTNIFYVEATSSDFAINESGAVGTGIFDNISVKEVGQDWNFVGGFSMGDGKAVCDGSGRINPINNSWLSGKTYKLSIEVLDRTTGYIRIQNPSVSTYYVNNLSSNGTHTYYIKTVDADGFVIEAVNGFDGSIDNVSVKEVGQNWSFVNGSEFTEQGARINNTVTGANANISQINSNFTQGKLIVFKYDVVATNGKRCVIEQIGDNIDLDTLTVGTNKKVYFVFDRADAKLIIKRAESSTDVTLDNVSIKEITDATDLPRLDYSDGGCPSLLLEPQSTNLITYSEDLTKSDWSKHNSTASTSTVVNPQGTSNTSLYVCNNYTGSNQFFRINPNTTYGNNVVYTYSMFVKYNSFQFCKLSYINYPGFQNFTAVFDIINGTVTTTNSFGSPQNTNSNIEDFGNGWFRISISGALNSSAGEAMNFEFNKAPSGTPTFGIYGRTDQTTTTNDKVYIWGAQLEELPYATSYIPTNGSVQTRLKDQASRSGLQDHINSTEGVFYAEFSGLGNDSVNRIISLSDGSSSNRITIQYNSDNNFFQQVRSGGTAVAGKTTTISDITDNIKTAIKYKENDFAFWLNGVEIHTDTSGAAPTGLNRVGFDNGSGSNNFHGRVKDLRVYNTALSDEDLTSLTS